MNMRQLSRKLDDERQKQFLNRNVWEGARQRALNWYDAMLDEQSIRHAWMSQALSSCAKSFLTAFIRTYGATPVEEERMLVSLRSQSRLSGSECKIGLRELQSAGILLAVSKIWGERLWFIPSDSFILWMNTIFPCNICPLNEEEVDTLLFSSDMTVKPYVRPLSRQLLSAFAVIGLEGFELTAKGGLPKKTVTALVKSVEWDEGLLRSFGVNWAERDQCPLAAALLLETANEWDLLIPCDGNLIWNEEKLESWLMLCNDEREQMLMEWCYRIFFASSSMLSQLYALLSCLQDEVWYSVDAALIRTAEVGLLRDELEVDRTQLDNFLRLLHSFGWVELAECGGDGPGKLMIRWMSRRKVDRSSVDESSSIIVQPNGEILADSYISFAIRWELELMTERVSDELITVYRLTSRSVARIMESGRTRSWIESLLERASGVPLDAMVQALLSEWTSRACRTQFLEAVLLCCDNEDMAAFIDADAGMSGAIIERIGPLHFIVNKEEMKELRAKLTGAGYPPRKGIQNGNLNSQHQNKSEKNDRNIWGDRKLYIYSPHPLHHYELFEGEDGYKQESYDAMCMSLPAMWTKGLRSYHLSTRKEMIEQAMNWEIPLQLQMATGLHAFIPERLEQNGNDWSVHGLLRDAPDAGAVRLTPDMWDDMKIVIPVYFE